MGELPNSLILETIEALRQSVEALRALERECVPDPIAMASIDSARTMLSRAHELVLRLDGVSLS